MVNTWNNEISLSTITYPKIPQMNYLLPKIQQLQVLWELHQKHTAPWFWASNKEKCIEGCTASHLFKFYFHCSVPWLPESPNYFLLSLCCVTVEPLLVVTQNHVVFQYIRNSFILNLFCCCQNREGLNGPNLVDIHVDSFSCNPEVKAVFNFQSIKKESGCKCLNVEQRST